MANKTTENSSTTSTSTAAAKKTMPVDNASVKKDDMKSSPLHQFFVSALKDIYYAENAIIDALEKMQEAATTEELKDAFEDHQLQTKKHVSRLEKVFRLIDEEPEKKECEAIKGIIKEGEEVIKSTQEGSMTRDAALIIAAQKVEHYEIATYGGLTQLAITMGHDKAADLLEKTLQEEEDTDYQLTEIAETSINFDAEQED
ncbi:MAG: ferritin-like domain-containing protein [Chryseobacterium sp.]|jgi:ferritin-like metal-binding protein YciE|uniref:ferritin-like domain-containing protein n=1 Tax=Chryseobacterium sp. TaxID=1871047 RepID=UPI0028276930|nr:ferritin-like domain-containing protein [Chryseobacterium sp.]MDR2235867.1 ferritin-like domain-containing protein [Chryseobacterium sp.]